MTGARTAALAGTLAAALLAASMTRPAAAGAQWLQPPVLYLEPGVRTVDAISAESGIGAQSGFNLRVVTVVPTRFRHVDLFAGAQFAPFGLSNGGPGYNDVAFFYGARLPLLRARRTGGWLDVALPVMGYYRYDPTGRETTRLFVHDLVLELAISAHVGEKMLRDLGGLWARSSIYLLVDQPISETVDPLTEQVDRFRPTFYYGISLPIAGRR